MNKQKKKKVGIISLKFLVKIGENEKFASFTSNAMFFSNIGILIDCKIGLMTSMGCLAFNLDVYTSFRYKIVNVGRVVWLKLLAPSLISPHYTTKAHQECKKCVIVSVLGGEN